MPAFHASEIVGRDVISDSRWKGWTFDQEKAAFIDAVNVVTDRTLCTNMWSVGCSCAFPPQAELFADKDVIWFMLFMRLFHDLLDTFPAQQGFTFMFDDKPEVMIPVAKLYGMAKKLFDENQPEKMAKSTIAFNWRRRCAPTSRWKSSGR